MAKSKERGMQAFDQTLLNLYYKARQHEGAFASVDSANDFRSPLKPSRDVEKISILPGSSLWYLSERLGLAWAALGWSGGICKPGFKNQFSRY